MELDFALLGLIKLHPGATGYDLNRLIKESTGYFLSASLSHIYPALKRLHDQNMVSYSKIPLKNRPNKKIYLITERGETTLKQWLEEPIVSSLDFKPFCLRMSFSPLMSKETILRHIDHEITYREGLHAQAQGRGIFLEVEYLDKDKFDLQRTEALWNAIYQLHVQTENIRLDWLREWGEEVQQKF